MKRKSIIPIIGSGFTRNCKSFRGKTPSGTDYKQYMIEEITIALELSSDEKKALSTRKFSEISSKYYKVVDKKTRERYLRNNFTSVCLEENKRNFLTLPWPYIYTLNIDDGIEKCSEYTSIILPNRKLNDDEDIFDKEKCIIKLHGDVHEILKYNDTDNEVLTTEQYVRSLRKNEALLSKLKHDSLFQNLLFIGCSLDDEIDLIDSLVSDGDGKNQTAKYICLTKEPTKLDILDYEKYGITHCLIFDSFDCFYTELYAAGTEASKIQADELSKFNKFDIINLPYDYEVNKPYLFFGKGLVGKDHSITIPYFFISREKSSQVIKSLDSHCLQLIVGSRCSGKTYMLADIAQTIRDRDVYFFETKDRLSEKAFEQLLQTKNSVILIDSGALTSDQFETVLRNLFQLSQNMVRIIISVNKNDREVTGILTLLDQQGIIDIKTIPQIEVSSVFSEKELAQINTKLAVVSAGLFRRHRSIVDNIIKLSDGLKEKHKFTDIEPHLRNNRELAALIALGIERKIYTTHAIRLDLYDELYVECKIADPLIDFESTWMFERSNADNSPKKFVLNAEYWLCDKLENYLGSEEHNNSIADAFRYIITKLIAFEGAPNLQRGKKNPSYGEYIYFDNINRLFSNGKKSGESGLALIRIIYDKLNDLLSEDPNYKHQRAKCYIKSSYYERNIDEKIKYLDAAYRDANVAHTTFAERYNMATNEKIAISRDHVAYTLALIYCHKCHVHHYENIQENSVAVTLLNDAFNSPYNTYSFVRYDTLNYQSVIEKTISTVISNKNLVSPDVYHCLEQLYSIISDT